MLLRGISKSLKFMILDTSDLIKDILKKTNVDILYSRDVAKIGTLSAILAKNLKSDNVRSSLILKSNGAISSIIAKSTTNSNIALKINIDNEKHDKLLKAINENDVESIDKLYNLKESSLQFMIDYGLKNPYSSIFVINDGLIENAMKEYYEKSEQTESIIICSVKYDDELNLVTSSGLLIQLLPNGDKEVLERIRKKLLKLTTISDMIYHKFSLEKIAYLIFEDDEEIFKNEEKYIGVDYDKLPMIEDITLLGEDDIKFECDCSEKYMENAIKVAISKEEIKNIIKEDGFIEIECSFCNKKYKFNEID